MVYLCIQILHSKPEQIRSQMNVLEQYERDVCPWERAVESVLHKTDSEEQE